MMTSAPLSSPLLGGRHLELHHVPAAREWELHLVQRDGASQRTVGVLPMTEREWALFRAIVPALGAYVASRVRS
jgi:hypothetical protein